MKNAIWKISGTLTVGLLAGTYLSGLAGGQAVSFGPAGTALLVGPGMTVTVNGIPTPQQMMTVREQLPFTVPAGKLFVVTGLGSTDETLSSLRTTLNFGGLAVLVAKLVAKENSGVIDNIAGGGPSVAPVPPGLVAQPGTQVSVLDNSLLGSGVVLGYLADA